VVVGIAAELGGWVGVGLGSGAWLASAGFAWPKVAPSVGCCCCHWHCWPDHCRGCSSCSPFKKDLEKRSIIILYPETIYAVIFIYLYLSDEVMDKVPKQSHDSHRALTIMQPNIHTTRLTTLT
jgi:hypothetical protein